MAGKAVAAGKAAEVAVVGNQVITFILFHMSINGIDKKSDKFSITCHI